MNAKKTAGKVAQWCQMLRIEQKQEKSGFERFRSEEPLLFVRLVDQQTLQVLPCPPSKLNQKDPTFRSANQFPSTPPWPPLPSVPLVVAWWAASTVWWPDWSLRLLVEQIKAVCKPKFVLLDVIASAKRGLHSSPKSLRAIWITICARDRAERGALGSECKTRHKEHRRWVLS